MTTTDLPAGAAVLLAAGDGDDVARPLPAPALPRLHFMIGDGRRPAGRPRLGRAVLGPVALLTAVEALVLASASDRRRHGGVGNQRRRGSPRCLPLATHLHRRPGHHPASFELGRRSSHHLVQTQRLPRNRESECVFHYSVCREKIIITSLICRNKKKGVTCFSDAQLMGNS